MLAYRLSPQTWQHYEQLNKCSTTQEMTRATRSRVRKYDLMSAKDLQRTALAVDSDSEDDLFEPNPSDRQKLVTAGNT
ncbi:hypothetical protein OESDEN_22642 [Oesophagostomum dentatum]|uniref:Uncharacterized protein n=1 Tax=Oesophagostomum dentatum TaxID=61180 RepID=A0A0B1RXE7_OESDE|nr:hypothetical protein OESDEN_22642 [Oesophagostomum dentatum]